MIPEDMGRRLRAELDDASEIYGAALVHVQIGSSQNGGRGHCEWRAGWREILPSIMQFISHSPFPMPFINPKIPELC